MTWFTGAQLSSMDDLFLDQIQGLYDAEQRLVQELPKMAEAAHQQSLTGAFQSHLRETPQHVKRLGKDSAVRLLDESLGEEKAADQKLTQLAESGINQNAPTA